MKPFKPENETGKEKPRAAAPSETGGDIGKVYIDYYDALRRFLARRFSSPEEVEDLVQETFLRAIQHHNPELKPSLAFLFKIASNLSKDRFRENHRRFVDEHVPIDDVSISSPSGSPEQILRSKQGIEAMKRIFRDQNPNYRRVFLLHRFKGLTYDEIAIDLGISRSQVKYYMYHVIAQLKQIIVDYI
ncbi:MAG: sigma-70 family RNA polymerase sigma factor [Deltaproteobacteria bacterium]|nr:sigma-70 family RNA polymerase sigma factor [Deltaproteobacteria bacterium]